MYCEFCGTQIGDNEEYCPNCGALVTDDIIPPQPQEPVQPQVNVRAPRPVEPQPQTQTSVQGMGLPEINTLRTQPQAYTQQSPQRPVQPQPQPQTPQRPVQPQPQTQRHAPTTPLQGSYRQEQTTPLQGSYEQEQTTPKQTIQIPTPNMADLAGKAGDSFKKAVDVAASFVPSPVGNALDVTLAQDEVLVKKYNCADLKGVMGYMMVTNKRLMFTAAGGRSRINQEVTLSSVSGLTCHRGTNLLWNRIVTGIVLALIGLYSFFPMGDSYYGGGGIGMLGFMLLIFGVILIFLGFRPAYMVAIYAKDVSLSPIVVGEGPKSLLGNSALYAFYCKPTAETEVMISELGALVQDMQSLGDLAISKWQNS